MKLKAHFLPVTIGVSLAALIYAAYQLGLLAKIELHSLDLRFQMRGTVAPEAPIVVVSIDQDSFDELNLPWPWPRDLHATLVRKLSSSRARVIGLDILFTEPSSDAAADAKFASAVRQSGRVILSGNFNQRKTAVAAANGESFHAASMIPQLRQGALGCARAEKTNLVGGTGIEPVAPPV